MEKVKQIEKLKKIAEKYDVPVDLYDWEANVDETLDIAENESIIEEDIKVLAGSQDFKAKVDVEQTNKKIKEEKESIARIKLEQINAEMDHTEKEFKESLKNLEKNSGVLDKLYYLPKEYVKVVTNKNNDIHGLILHGKAGTSKSFSSIQALNETKCDYTYFSGYTTPLALYTFLEDNKERDVIVIDDTISIFNNVQATTLLLNALYSNSDKRKVMWNSSKLKDVASEFIMDANIIMIINEIPNGIGKTLLNSRCLSYEFDFTNYEILTIMKAIADIPSKNLTKAERHKIVDYIADNTDETSQGFDLRVQNKIENLYRYSKEKWKDLCEPILNTKNQKLVLLKEFIRNSVTLEEAKQKWITSTGLSHRQFNRYQLKLKGEVKTVH